ncbi:MAG: hypothetical protein LBS23_01350 [Holosporaceae bacterium]|nr:hypothetical protein [Holosporaceae bacterium]
MKKTVFSMICSATLLAAGAMADDNANPAADNNAESAAANENAVIGRQSQVCGGCSFYLGLGGHAANLGERTDFKYKDSFTYSASNDKKTVLGGSLVLGLSKKINNLFCVSLEAGADFSPNVENTHQDRLAMDDTASRYYDLEARHNGSRPFGAMRIGAFVDQYVLVYLKAGASYGSSAIKYSEYAQNAGGGGGGGGRLSYTSNAKLSAVQPDFGIGVESSLSGKLSCRVEACYRLPKSKDCNVIKQSTGDLGDTVKLHQKDTVTFRILFCYNMKLS